jgi:hypothetical protein
MMVTEAELMKRFAFGVVALALALLCGDAEAGPFGGCKLAKGGRCNRQAQARHYQAPPGYTYQATRQPAAPAYYQPPVAHGVAVQSTCANGTCTMPRRAY